MIPNTLHYMSSKGYLDEEQERCIQSFKNHNPKLETIHWTDKTIDSFIKKNYSPQVYEMWISNTQGGPSKRGMLKKWDSSRLYILNKIGGVWTDSDCTCLRPLEPMLKSSLSIRRPIYRYGPMFDEQYSFTETPPHICNAFFACAPDNDILKEIISEIAIRFEQDPLQNVGSATACLLYGEVVQSRIRNNDLADVRLLEYYEFKEGPELLEWIPQGRFDELFVVHKLGDEGKRYRSFESPLPISEARDLFG